MSWFDDALAQPSKKGGTAVFRGTDLQIASHIPFGIPSRIPQLDHSFGRNGYPAGRSVEIFGFEHSGKSCAAMSAVASIQRMGGAALWIDAERQFDADWAAENGVNPNEIRLAYADTIEDIFSIQDEWIEKYLKVPERERTPFMMVIDSITSVPSRESSEKDYGDVQRIGTDARAIRNGMRKLNAKLAEAKILSIYINHAIANATSPIGGSLSAGGHALKFNAGLRIQLIRKKNVTEDEEDDEKIYRGMEVEIKIEKNRVGRTKSRQFKCFLLENGFDLYENLFDACKSIGVIERLNNRTYLFKPKNEQISRKDWRPYIEGRSGGIDGAYAWFLDKAAELEEIRKYGGQISRSE